MKKNYLFAVVLGAAVLTGCSQDEQLNIVKEKHSGFVGVLESSDSRTTLGNDYSVNWVVGDQVSIFEKDNQNTQYEVKSVDNGVAKFDFVNYTEKDNPVTLDAYYSVYPYNGNNSINENGVITATVPSKIENYTDKDDAINQGLMVAKSESTDLHFTNAQGYLLLRLQAQKPNNYGDIKSIKLTSAKYNLAGTATMSWTDNIEKPEAKIVDNNDATKELTINLASELQKPLPKSTEGSYAEFYIPVVPTKFEKNSDGTGDVTMTITFAEDIKYVKNIGIEFIVGRNKIKPLKHIVGSQDFTGETEGTESVWDGETLTEIELVDGVYTVTKPSELAWLASKGVLTENNNNTESVTIELQNNLDMGSKTISALIAQRGDELVFKGNNKTISNVNIISGNNDNTTGQASMFYCYPNSTLTVTDLTLENITVTADVNSTGYAAAVVGYCEGAVTLTNVDVVNATITGVKSSGMLVGHLSGSLVAEDCDLSGIITLNEYEQGGHYAGEYIGTIAGAATLTDCTENVTVNGNLKDTNVGTICGRMTNAGSLTIDGVTGVTNNDQLTVAINASKTNIILLPGKYTTIVAKSNIILQGTPGTIVNAVNLNGSNNVTVKSITFDAAGAVAAYKGYNKDEVQQYANIVSGSKTSTVGARNIVIDDCTFTGKFTNGGVAIAFTDKGRPTGGSGNITIKNCTFNTENAYYDVYGYYTGSPEKTFTIEDNTFNTVFTQGIPIYLGRLKTNEAIVVKGNAFKTTTSIDDSVNIQGDDSYNPTLDQSNNIFGE